MGQLPKSFFFRFHANSSLGAWVHPSTDRSWFERTWFLTLHEATRRFTVRDDQRTGKRLTSKARLPFN